MTTLKRYLLTAFLFCITKFSLHAQQLKAGDSLPKITLFGVMNAPVKPVNSVSLKGKVIILEFWATWCTPCIKNFSKLDEMQTNYKDKLQIIALSEETPDRISAFLKNRPVKFWIGADTTGFIKEKFTHTSLPHAILIDPTGVIRAVMKGNDITPDIIEQVYRGETPAVKNEIPVQQTDNVFNTPARGEEVFRMKGFQSQARPGKTVDEFSLTYINTHFSRFFLDVYNMHYARLRYRNLSQAETQPSNENLYCLQIASHEMNYAGLLEKLKAKLSEQFAYKTRLQKEADTVYVIKRIGNPDTSIAKASGSIKGGRTNKGNYTALNQPIGKGIANYLEAYGIIDGPVLDETNDILKKDVQFKWQPEKKEAVEEFLAALGLKLERHYREYEVLVVYKE